MNVEIPGYALDRLRRKVKETFNMSGTHTGKNNGYEYQAMTDAMRETFLLRADKLKKEAAFFEALAKVPFIPHPIIVLDEPYDLLDPEVFNLPDIDGNLWRYTHGEWSADRLR